MKEIAASNAPAYLAAVHPSFQDQPIEARELAGGVSNAVLLITLPARDERFVLKQARGQLRVAEEWLCSVERIWREVEVLRICGELLKAAIDERITFTVPQVLWEDRENYLYAMTAAPVGNRTWKEILLAGDAEQNTHIARACGRALGQLHAGSWQDQAIATGLNDRTYFDQLRLDPYYRQVARVHPDLGSKIQALIDSVWQHCLCLVHGDFSPKNLLVSPGQVLLIDFEVGHYGDPAFDLGFFLTHLVLKSIWAAERRDPYLRLITEFWDAYRQQLEPRVGEPEMAALEERSLLNLAACLLARVDGKSRVDYLPRTAQDNVRAIARSWLLAPPRHLNAVVIALGTPL